MLSLILILVSAPIYVDAAVSCKDFNGEDVDWFVALKRPTAVDSSGGTSFVYFDSNANKWVESKEKITDKDSAIGATVSQLYKDKSKRFYITYNDHCPEKPGANSYTAHSKGVAVFDRNQGFWMVHSVPKFPVEGKYAYPEGQTKFAQSFLCMTFSTNELPNIVKYMRTAQVNPCMKNLPEAIKLIAPELQNVIGKKRLSKTDPHTAMRKFCTFSDLWYDFVSANLKAPMAVETWRNGGGKDVGSQCSVNANKVYDITVVNTLNISYESSKDHSKWGVSMKDSVREVCIGDVNRQESQYQRGGGALCLANPKLWQTFYCSVGEYQDCSNKTKKNVCRQ
ncbi:hypothetical protein Aduo_006059 [Ancylostoma duodenale]